MNKKFIIKAMSLMLILSLSLTFAACGKQGKQPEQGSALQQEQNAQPQASTVAAGGKADISKLKKDEVLKCLATMPEKLEKAIPLSQFITEDGTMTSWQYMNNMFADQKTTAGIILEYSGDIQKYKDFYMKLLADSQVDTPNTDRATIKGSLNGRTYTVQIREAAKEDGTFVSEVAVSIESTGLELLLTAVDIPFQKNFAAQENLETSIALASYSAAFLFRPAQKPLSLKSSFPV